MAAIKPWKLKQLTHYPSISGHDNFPRVERKGCKRNRKRRQGQTEFEIELVFGKFRLHRAGQVVCDDRHYGIRAGNDMVAEISSIIAGIQATVSVIPGSRHCNHWPNCFLSTWLFWVLV
ncbi:hypothetical protein J6590_036029 [Homalodisca vitripennis]|nr:hypothetical protein J6590_036029 [Homalodisca vitripennis]